MYLVELHKVTGLVKVDGQFDGIRSIKEFREILDDENLGIKCMTAIALTADYLTPIKYYREEDRPYKAMEISCEGNRRAFDWHQDKIQAALNKYDELQYNPTVEEKRTLDLMLLEKLKEIRDQKNSTGAIKKISEATVENIIELSEYNKDVARLLETVTWELLSKREKSKLDQRANVSIIYPYNEKKKEEEEKRNEEKLMDMFKQLETIKSLINNFKKQHEEEDIYADGPVVNGYKLSRLEEKRLDKNSFYHKQLNN